MNETIRIHEGKSRISHLRIEDLTHPIGIDTPAPVFSWKMQSEQVGAKQTAYRICVREKQTGKVVWDTDWVQSDDSTGIAYGGEALTASTRYTVQVEIKDQNGQTTEPVSDEFETGLMADDGFADAAWITDPSPDDASLATNYQIDVDFIVDTTAMGLCFGMQNGANYAMWQVNTVKGAAQGQTRLRPHFKVNGGWRRYDGFSDVDVTAAIGTPDEVNGQLRHIRIAVNGERVQTYLGRDAASLRLVHDAVLPEKLPLYNIGFRHDKEKARYANLLVSDNEGNTVYDLSFTDAPTMEGGNPSGWSIEDGMLKFSHPGEQVYLLRNQKIETPPSLPGYRKVISIRENLVSAKLYTCGLGVYEAYVDGQRVANQINGDITYEELKPGYTQTGVRLLYSSFDVTWMLSEGEHVLSAVVSSGWWAGGIVGFFGKKTGFIAKLILTYADGSQEILTTDTTWKYAYAAKLQAGTGIYDGERYDNRVDESWMLPGFDDASWEYCAVNTEYRGKISAFIGVPVTVRKDLERVAESLTVFNGADNASDGFYGKIHTVRDYANTDEITLRPGETLLVDFGQNLAGWEAFEVKAPSGTEVHVRHGEILNDGNGALSRGNDGPEGSIYNANYRSATANTVYTAAGMGDFEAYHPSHSFYGFRYIEITVTEPATLRRIVAQVVTSSHEDTGDLITSDRDVNRLVSNIRWGMYSNYLSVPTDCPQRDERKGWTGDAQVFSIAGNYLGFSKSFLTKHLQDMRDTQGKDGAFPSVAPCGNPNGHFGWADAGIIIPYNLYMMYGDPSVITRHWDAMQKYVDGFLAGNGGPNTFWGDWLSYESNDQGLKDILAVAFYAWDARMMTEMATVLGRSEDAVRYQKLYEEQKSIFAERFVDEDGKLRRGEQTICAYALYLDLLPDERSVEAVTEQLISNIQGHGNQLQTGFLGTAILMDTLTKIGRTDVAYKLLLQHGNPSWLYSVDQGATTIWERWNSYTRADGFGDVRMNSFNHYSYGAVAGWMFRCMAGIDFDTATPGFAHILLHPRFDDSMPRISAEYESARGRIAVSMTKENGNWCYTATIPANTTAAVTLPAAIFGAGTRVNGKPIQALSIREDGIASIEQSVDELVLEAVAGSFTVVSAV